MAKHEPKEDKNEKISIMSDMGNIEVKCGCCLRKFPSNKGRYIITGNFICNECGENCDPKGDQCMITKVSRTFSFD